MVDSLALNVNSTHVTTALWNAVVQLSVEDSHKVLDTSISATRQNNFPTIDNTVIMTQEEKPIWEGYVPDTCYLYYVDYRDSFDEHEDLLQECLEKNDLCPITEKIFDWWEFPEQYELEEIRKAMENDDLEEEYEEHEEEIRELLWERDKSTPVDDLFSNTGDVTMYYSCDLDLDHGWREAFLCNPWQNESNAMAAYKIRRFLGIKKGTPEAELIDTICNESPYGGELRLYFMGDIRDFINYDSDNDFKTIHFEGEVAVAVYNSAVGSGWYEMVKINRDIPFMRDNLRVSSQDHYSITHCFGMDYDFCKSNNQKVEVSVASPKRKLKLKVSQKITQEKHFEEVFKNGGCSPEDDCMDRHRDVVYINEIPCRWECPHCGRVWYD